MFGGMDRLFILTILAIFVKSEILTPPYFNLAEKKKITATATCGVDTEGPELYCKLVGANADSDIDVNLIQGQVRVKFSLHTYPLFRCSNSHQDDFLNYHNHNCLVQFYC